MRRFIHRESSEDDDDPFAATKRTIKFEKKVNESQLQEEFEMEDDEIYKKSGLSKSEFDEIGNVDSFSVSIKDKEQQVKESYKRELDERKILKTKISNQSKNVEQARKNFFDKQKELQEIIKVQTSDKSSQKFSLMGQYTSKMAHDIRNPLTVIKGQVELMKMRYGKEEDQIMLKSLESMERAIQSITTQVNDVLSFMRESPSNVADCDLQKLITTSIREVKTPPRIEIETPDETCVVKCDIVKTQSVFVNIILNSIQAIDDEGTIKISFNEDEKNAIVTIEDSGPGIPEENIEKIFEPLFTTKPTGTGLGLANCKHVLELQQGSIAVKNNPTTFTITLPLKTDSSKNQ